jgi:hypothetical protein
MAKTYECERDGVVLRGTDDDELVANVQRHVAAAHPDLVGKLSRDDILAASDEADPHGEGGSR